MAKTRSQTKRQTELARTKSRSLMLKKTIGKTHSPAEIVQNCCVKLLRLDLHKIDCTQIYVHQIDLTKRNLGLTRMKKTVDQKKLDSKRYNLRKVTTAKPLQALKPVRRPMTQLIASSNAALHTSRAIRLWDELKKRKSVDLKMNDIVCARMSGHRPWPSKILEFKKNGVSLRFYGTHDIGLVKKSEILPIEICQDVLGEYMKISTNDLPTKSQLYHLSFIKAVKESACIDSSAV